MFREIWSICDDLWVVGSTIHMDLLGRAAQGLSASCQRWSGPRQCRQRQLCEVEESRVPRWSDHYGRENSNGVSILFDHFYPIEFVPGSQIRRAFSRRLLDRPLNIQMVGLLSWAICFKRLKMIHHSKYTVEVSHIEMNIQSRENDGTKELYGIVAAGVGKKLLVVGDCKFPYLKRHLGQTNTNWLASWGWGCRTGPRTPSFPRFLVGSFQDRDYDSKLGLEPWQSGIFGFYKPGASETNSPKNWIPWILDPLDFLVALDVWRRPLGRLMGYNGLAGKFPARKWPIVLRLSNFSYDGHFVISPILSRHGWRTSSDEEAEALPWGHIFCWRWEKWISSTLESRDLRDFCSKLGFGNEHVSALFPYRHSNSIIC